MDELVPGDSSCPSCRSRNLYALRVPAHDIDSAPDISVRACRDCDFAWQWPLYRSSDESRQYFESEYEASEAGSYFDPEQRLAIARLEFDFVRDIIPSARRLLDIGGGDGTFASVAAKAGWSASCVDPALPVTVREDGVVYHKGLPDDLPAGETFDVVTLWDVIEHVERPGALIAAARRRLEPGGRIVVETGNYQSAGRIAAGRNWWCYQADHRWYFTPPALEQLLGAAGFRDFRIHDRVLRPWWNGSAAFPGPSVAGFVKQVLRAPHRGPERVRTYRQLRRAAAGWPQWGGLEIFTASAALS